MAKVPEYFTLGSIADAASISGSAMRAYYHRKRLTPDAWASAHGGRPIALFTSASVDRILKQREKDGLGEAEEIATLKRS